MKYITLLALIYWHSVVLNAQSYKIITAELRPETIDTFSLESAFTLNKYLFDTTQVIIFYADTSSYEIQLYDGISETIISRGGIIYWILGYETEGIFLDERKKPISTNIIVIDYKPLK